MSTRYLAHYIELNVLSLNAILLKTQEASFGLDAFIEIPHTPFSVAAVIFKTQDASFGLDATFGPGGDFSLDAIVQRTWEGPFEEIHSGVTVVGTSSAFENTSETITLDRPIGTQSGDLLVGFVSWDAGLPFPLLELPDESWMEVTEVRIPNPAPIDYPFDAEDHYLTILSRVATDADPSSWTFATLDTYIGDEPLVAAKAGAIITFRGTDVAEDAVRVEETNEITVETYTTDDLPMPDAAYFGSEPSVFLDVVASAGPGQTFVNPSPDPVYVDEFADPLQEEEHVVELVDVTADDHAGLAIYWWSELQDYVNPRFYERHDTPTGVDPKSEPWLGLRLRLPRPRPAFGLYAEIGEGADFSLAAFIQAATHTTHPRTGPHYDQTPSDYITLSNALGTLSAGDTLTEALTELDQKITDLEEGST